MDTNVLTNKSVQEALELVTPALPVTFTSAVLIDAGVDCVWEWLKENAPQEVQNVFQGMLFGWEMKCESLEHGGQVLARLDDPKMDWFLGAVKAMAALGYKFS